MSGGLFKWLKPPASAPSPTTQSLPAEVVDLEPDAKRLKFAIECPMCGKSFPSSMEVAATEHASECQGDVKICAAPSSTTKSPPSSQSSSAPPPKSAASGNAFAMLMSASRGKRQRFVFELSNPPHLQATLAWTSALDNEQVEEDASSDVVLQIGLGRPPRDAEVKMIARGVGFLERVDSSSSSSSVKISSFSIPELKSILQKAVRRRSVELAQRAAFELAHRDWSELARRLPIILIEDVCLHPNLDALCFFMMACRKNSPLAQPTPSMLQFLVRVVGQACACPVLDRTWCARREPPLPQASASDKNVVVLDETPKLCPKANSLVRSLEARACYGGMRGDVDMLRASAALWRERFSGERDGGAELIRGLGLLFGLEDAPAPPVLSTLFGWTALESNPDALAGIDFHVMSFDGVVRQLACHKGDLEASMWANRSGVNERGAPWTSPKEGTQLMELLRSQSPVEAYERRGIRVLQRKDDLWERAEALCEEVSRAAVRRGVRPSRAEPPLSAGP